MHSIDQLRSLYAYHFDTTLRLLSLAENLELHGTQEPGERRRSIRDLLFHILDADRGWRVGLEIGKRPERLRHEDYIELVALKRQLEREKSAWDILLASLDEKKVGRDIDLEAGPGRVFSFGRWKVLYHVLLHGMQHHAEIAEQLTRADESPGDIDFIFYS